MNSTVRQRSAIEEQRTGDDGASGGADGLAQERAETDRLFDVAKTAFEAMTQGDSREFLRRSRQTGGQ